MITVPFWLGTIFGGIVGFTLCSIFSWNSYDKGYKDGREGL